MSVKKTTQSTTDKILNSDIYDITKFVDDIKKINIDGVDDARQTLIVGMYGYLGYEFASLLQNSIVVSSELANEAIPTRAKFDRNVITHALSLGVTKVAATAASMKVMIIFPEKALRNNMVDGKFILRATTPMYFDEHEFHTDYDIDIRLTKLTSSTNGNLPDYVYTAHYLMDNPNPISDIDNEYLPPISIFADETDNMVMLITTLHQVEYTEIEEKIVGNDDLANKTLSFSFENQLSHFSVQVYENGSSTPIELTPVYDGLYNQVAANYCYYQYINSNTIRIRFDPTNSYQPRTNCNVVIKLYTSHGYEGNFEYTDDLMVRLTSDEYTNLYMIIKQRGDEGSYGGLDRKTVEELQKIIPKEALSRGSITTLTDLRNYFNSINNETSVLHVFRKEDNILTRVYYTYCLMKDKDYNVVPTNTIPIYIEDSSKDQWNNRMYLESGSRIYYYKNNMDTTINIPFIKNHYIGYDDERSTRMIQYTYNDPTYNFNTYKFQVNAPIYFKIQGRDVWTNGVIKSVTDQVDLGLGFMVKKVDINFYYPGYGYHDNVEYVTATFFVPNPFDDCIYNMTTEEMESDTPFANMRNRFIEGRFQEIIEAVITKEEYSFINPNPEFNFNSLSLVPGDHIMYCLYDPKHPDMSNVNNSSTWELGEVLAVSTKAGRPISVTIMHLDTVTGAFITNTYRIPTIAETDPSLGGAITPNDLIAMYHITNFVYTNPLSIMLTDDPNIGSHRINASYFLDIINESRFLDFKCINSSSPIQFISSYVKVYRPSFLSENRYKYNITIELVPNIGTITNEMIARTQLIGVYYKDGAPICYSIGEYYENGTITEGAITYLFKLFTKPFGTRSDENEPVVIDDDGNLYIGNALSEEDFIYEVSSTNDRKSLASVYLPKNVEFRIYMMYKYAEGGINQYYDDLSRAYYGLNSTKPISGDEVPLNNIIPGDTAFETTYTGGSETNKTLNYTLDEMVLTNVYHTSDGLNLLYDYSNIMNSYVTMLKSNNVYDNTMEEDVIGYIINRVPVLRYFYLNDESKINTFITEMKRKILYVLDAIDPLETTFGLDFKFFNTYGPSNMYHITNADGEISDLINNVSLSMTFRTKFYNEDNDKESIIPRIKDDIKRYMENIEELNDLHIPNLITEIETTYAEYIIFFEYVTFNIYDANYQHIITNENMEMLTVVPEFLNINVDDSSGLPYININIVT